MMSTRRAFLLSSAAFVGAAMAGCEPEQSDQAELPVAPPPEQPTAEHLTPPLLGDAAAPKHLVMWGSYTCPFTAQLLGVLSGIVTSMPQTVSLEWHHFPIHPPDPALHVAGLAFKDAHFWGFTEHVLGEVLKAGGPQVKLTPEMLAAFARAEGGSEQTLAAAYADQAKWDAVKEDLIAGRLLGITRTPGLFYDGYFMTPNGIPRDLAAFDKSLRAMLQQG
jgi:protein-disulfide isomerase